MTEEWRPVPDVVGYEASSLGRIRGVDRVLIDKNGKRRNWKGRMLVLSITPATGYPKAVLGKGHQWDAHRVIALTFLGPPPGPEYQVCHFNGIPHDNRVSNLRWGTPKENTADAIRHGTHRGKATHCPHGHPYDEANTYVSPRQRACRACARRKASERYWRKKAARQAMREARAA